MYKNKENIEEENIENIVYDAFCKGVQMIAPFKNDLLKDNQKSYVLSVFKSEINMEDLENPKYLLKKLKKCLIEIYSVDENDTFNLNKPPRIICPEKNSDKFNNLLNRIIKKLSETTEMNEELGRNKQSLNTIPLNNYQNNNNILNCEFINTDDNKFIYVIKIKNDYKETIPKKYWEISNTLNSQEECELESERIISYLSRILS